MTTKYISIDEFTSINPGDEFQLQYPGYATVDFVCRGPRLINDNLGYELYYKGTNSSTWKYLVNIKKFYKLKIET